MLLSPYGGDKINCSGCGACQQACPQQSITMEIDVEGFVYPIINPDTCISCGLCTHICPIVTHWANGKLFETPYVYAGWNLDENIRAGSSSGGIFSAFADTILEQNGVVFGAAFDEQLHLQHIAVETKEQLVKLRGSKYLQSAIGNAFQQAEAYLKQEHPVLFTGTPCQVAGLYTYLQQDYEHLYTCDIFCHGVPSPKVFEKYLQNLAQKHHVKVTHYQFRSKYYGWRPYGIKIEFSDGKSYNTPGTLDPFTIGFLGNVYLRPICAVCPFTTTTRIADTSIGDFWGINKYYPELDDNKGISTILINTPKGKRLFEYSQSRLFTTPCDLEQAKQSALCRPSVVSHSRSAFFSDLDRLPFRKLQYRHIFGFREAIRYYVRHLKNWLLNKFNVICKKNPN